MTTIAKPGRRSLAALAAAALLAVGGISLAPTVAMAADTPVESGDFSWGISESWRGYVGVGSGQPGPGSFGDVVGEDGAVADAAGVTTWELSSGNVDVAAGTGSLQFDGTALLLGHPGTYYPYEYPTGSGQKWGMWQRWADPQVTVTSDTTATVSFAVSSYSAAPTFPTVDPAVRVDVVDLTFPAGDLADGTIESTSAVLTAEGAATVWNSYGTYQAGTEMDPVTINFQVEPPAPATETVTTAGVSASEVESGAELVLSATIEPIAAGTVQFVVNGTNYGEPELVDIGGFAGIFASDLPVGLNQVVAIFTPADPAEFAGSTSAPVTVQVNAAPLTTSTELAVTPAAPVVVGQDVQLNATVIDDNPSADAAGTVQFYTTPDGGAEEPLGAPVALVGGAATLTTNALSAGGHTFRAQFTSTNGFDPSSAATTTNFGVVDVSAPLECAAVGGETLTGVSASWDWNAYSNLISGGAFGWQKYADGNIAVETSDVAQTFIFNDGVATVTEDCSHIQFTGTMRVEAYNSFFPLHGQWVELENPELVLNADGSGSWVAGLRTGIGSLSDDPFQRTTILTVADASGVDFFNGTDVDGAVHFAYEDTTASGTWAAGGTSAWANGFVLQVPSAIRSFYYASGAGGDVNKPPADLQLNWEFISEPAAEVDGSAAGSEVTQGEDATFTAAGFRPGETVTVFVSGQEIAQVPAVDGTASVVWAVPADWAEGDASARFVGERSGLVVEASFTVLAAPDVPGGEGSQSGESGQSGEEGQSGAEEGQSGESGQSGEEGQSGAGEENAGEGSTGGKPELAQTGVSGSLGALAIAAVTLLAGAAMTLRNRRTNLS